MNDSMSFEPKPTENDSVSNRERIPLPDGTAPFLRRATGIHIHVPGLFCRDTLPLRYFQINPFLALRVNGRVIDGHVV